MASTADLLRSLGHVVRERDPDYGQVQPLFGPRYARGAWLDAQRLGRRSELERRTRGIVRVGARMERLAARARAKEAARAARINAIFDEHDVLMTPVTAAAPLPVGRYDGAGAARAFLGAGAFACYTAVWNVTGQPAASVPAGLRRRRDADGRAARGAPRRRGDAPRPRRADRAGAAVGPPPSAGGLSALS